MAKDLPRIGLGTYGFENQDRCSESVRQALEIGYRHIDTAQNYHVEEFVGQGLRDASIERDDVFLATKLSRDNCSYDDVLSSVESSLSKLGVEYLDLLYVHWPVGTYSPDETLPAMDKLYDDGLIRNIGVSNFSLELVSEARETLDSPLFAHQVEMHPLLYQQSFLVDALHNDYWLVAYSPIARGRVFDIPTIAEIANRDSVSAAQVSLAWLLCKDNVAVIPKATGEEHLLDNLQASALPLTPADVWSINDIDAEKRLVDLPSAPWNRT